MKYPLDLTGQTIGRLTVLGKSNSIGGHVYWRCMCRCGKQTEISRCNITRKTKTISSPSCGNCNLIERYPKEYHAWRGMQQRCYDENSDKYLSYGARGIKVYSLWRVDFLNFLEYIGPIPSSQYSVDRIDNNGNYEPGNVRWATKSEQQLNRRPYSEWKRGINA